MNDQKERMLQVHEKQRAHRWVLARTDSAQRVARLKKLRDALLERRADLHRALHLDFAKNDGEADITEIFPALEELNHAIRFLPRWMKPVRVRTPKALFGTRSEIRYEPKGQVLILSPWNYPVNLLLCPLVAAIAAGNCVMIKPSSKVPHTTRCMSDLLSSVFPEEEVCVFQGSSSVADELLELEFDHIFFTGSTRIGKRVLEAAGRHLTPTTLELGGKSPVIVDESADIEKAAQRVMWGKLVNAGQTCVAPDYLLIHEDQLNPFLEAAKKVVSHRYGSDEEARRKSDSYCRLVSEDHCRKLSALLEQSVAQGARVEMGGRSDPALRYMEPTLLCNVKTDSPIMEDEIFGPILPILTFEKLEDAMSIIRSRGKPLALYIFSRSKRNVELLLRNTSAGGSCVNSVMIHLANSRLPFGGVGHSGMGSYHGIHGFKNLSHERAVLRQGRIDTLKMFYPPYTEKVKKLIRRAMRYLS